MTEPATHTARPNTHAGFCTSCAAHVAAGGGQFGSEKIAGKLTVKHSPGECVTVEPSRYPNAWVSAYGRPTP